MPVSPSIEGGVGVGLIYESFIRKDQQPLPHGARGLLGGL